MKKKIVIVTVLLLIALGVWIWYEMCGGVSHRELKSSILTESQTIQSKVDARCDALDRKLDHIEAKLDKLIEMATPKLPDGMKPAAE